MIYFQLFWEFFLVGTFSIGGGLVALPFLYDIAERYDWFPASILPDMIAISESTPGPIGINMATYAGTHAAGLVGGALATAAIILPAFLIISIVSNPLHYAKQHRITKSIFYMLRPAVTALIAFSGWEIITTTLVHLPTINFMDLFNWGNLVIFLVVYVLYERTHLHPFFYNFGCAMLGILFNL